MRALVIDPAASDDPRSEFADTFRVIDPSAPALSVGELSTQRGDGIFETILVRDDDSGACWSPTPGPLPRTNTSGRYVVRHAAGVTRFLHD